jgi:CRP/FNR family cyclic AMP-dependent transcriptional regulator
MSALAKLLPSLRPLGSGASFRNESLHMLKDIELLSELNWREVELLAGYTQAFEADPGCVIFREGETGDYLCLLVSGRICIYKGSDDGSQTTVAMEGHGRSIGEMALVDGGPRSATCEAVESSTLLLLTREAFLRLAEERPALGFKLLSRIARLMSSRLRSTSGKLVDHLVH